MSGAEAREVIPKGTFLNPIRHLYPIAEFLRDAGLRLMREEPGTRPNQDGHLGFIPQPDGWRCLVGGPITSELWAALNQRFLIPRTIAFSPGAAGGGGMIRDSANWVDIIGMRVPLEPRSH